MNEYVMAYGPQVGAALIPILVAFIGLLGAVLVHARTAKERLRVELRLKLVFLAHEALERVTGVALDGFEALADLGRRGPGASGEHDASFLARQSFARAAVHLPPELFAEVDALETAYRTADAAVYGAVTDEGKGYGLADIGEFDKALTHWRQVARDWKAEAWKAAAR